MSALSLPLDVLALIATELDSRSTGARLGIDTRCCQAVQCVRNKHSARPQTTFSSGGALP